MLKKFLPALFTLAVLAATAAAQEVEVDRYTINARVDAAANTIEVRAVLAVVNLGRSAKSQIFLRLNKLAKVGSATVNSAPATFTTPDDRRVTTLIQLIITPHAAIEPGAKANIEINYRIQAQESSPLLAIYPGEVLLLPESVWFPMPSTMFTLYGPTTAPFTLTVTGSPNLRAASSGASKADANNQTFTFEQSLNSLPFLIANGPAQASSTDSGGVRVEFALHPGLVGGTNSSEIVSRLGDEAGRIVAFYTKTLGALPASQSFRIISSARADNVVVPGAVVFEEQVFRQDMLDAVSIERLADAIARMWIDGRARVRGQEPRSAEGDRPAQKARSYALLRDSLPRYLAALYIEDRFGKDAAREVFNRQRWSYTPVAQSGRDAEMGIQTILIPTYTAAAFGKGPLVLRLISETVGREKFINAVKAVFSGPQTKVVTSDELRQALVKEGGPAIDKLFQQWVETIIEPDLVVGVPQPSDKPGSQRINLRNLGTGEVAAGVQAVTASGKQLAVSVTVPSEDITSADIQTAEKITSVEVDPEKLIVQTNYDNDAKPTRVSAQTLFGESLTAFNKGEHAQAETKLREAARAEPQNSLLRAWLARVLAAQNKMDEAASEANAAIKIEPPAPAALAWAYITLGQVALSRSQAAEAVQHLRRALVVADEAPAQFAARAEIVRAERAAAMTPQIEESIRAFISQLDNLIKQPTSDKLFTVIDKNNLKRFVQGLTVSPPTAWSTEILRAEQIDAGRVAIDVALKVKTKQGDQSGTAVFVLYRSAGGWMLEDVQLFNVK
jgi:TolA-binding protein